jgi:uncharacterized protein (TIGR02145 family)
MGIYKDYPYSIYNNGAGGGGGGDVGAPYLKNIMPTTGVKVVDENGYIGGNFLGAYYPNTNYYNNFAIVVPGADYSNEGLGNVTFVDTTATIGGRVYRTVTIGGVTWLAENLDYKFSGCGIGGSDSPTTPNAWYYNNDETSYGIDGERKCGLLYNWYAVKLLDDNRGDLIPGWHVPTSNEWNALRDAVGGYSVAGTRLKAADVSWAPSWGGADDYGFGVLPAGYYISGFSGVGSESDFWSITVSGTGYEYCRFSTNASIQSSTVSGNGRVRAYSVRLVKDSA